MKKAQLIGVFINYFCNVFFFRLKISYKTLQMFCRNKKYPFRSNWVFFFASTKSVLNNK